MLTSGPFLRTHISTYNRTIEELKLSLKKYRFTTTGTYNRTIEELKYVHRPISKRHRSPYNRTIEELKLFMIVRQYALAKGLIIVP